MTDKREKAKDIVENTFASGRLTITLRWIGAAHLKCQLYRIVKRTTCFMLAFEASKD